MFYFPHNSAKMQTVSFQCPLLCLPIHQNDNVWLNRDCLFLNTAPDWQSSVTWARCLTHWKHRRVILALDTSRCLMWHHLLCVNTALPHLSSAYNLNVLLLLVMLHWLHTEFPPSWLEVNYSHIWLMHFISSCRWTAELMSNQESACAWH